MPLLTSDIPAAGDVVTGTIGCERWTGPVKSAGVFSTLLDGLEIIIGPASAPPASKIARRANETKLSFFFIVITIGRLAYLNAREQRAFEQYRPAGHNNT